MKCRHKNCDHNSCGLFTLIALIGGAFGLYKVGYYHLSPKRKAARTIQKKLANGWEINKEAQLYKTFVFKDSKNLFDAAFQFADKVRKVANEHNHHPDLIITWGKVIVTTWTHDAQCVTDKDQALAKDIDAVFKKM